MVAVEIGVLGLFWFLMIVYVKGNESCGWFEAQPTYSRLVVDRVKDLKT